MNSANRPGLAPAALRALSAPKTILLVDDEASVRELIGRVLRSENYRVLTAENGAEALHLAAATPIDLALLDLNMPVKSGWDTFAELTSEDPLLPVIIITARSNQLFTAASSGAGALMEKPLDFPQLLETIRVLLAESPDQRLARIAGRSALFRYGRAHD